MRNTPGIVVQAAAGRFRRAIVVGLVTLITCSYSVGWAAVTSLSLDSLRTSVEALSTTLDGLGTCLESSDPSTANQVLIQQSHIDLAASYFGHVPTAPTQWYRAGSVYTKLPFSVILQQISFAIEGLTQSEIGFLGCASDYQARTSQVLTSTKNVMTELTQWYQENAPAPVIPAENVAFANALDYFAENCGDVPTDSLSSMNFFFSSCVEAWVGIQDAVYDRELTESHQPYRTVLGYQTGDKRNIDALESARMSFARVTSEISESLGLNGSGTVQLNDAKSNLLEVQECLQTTVFQSSQGYAECYLKVVDAMKSFLSVESALHETGPWVRSVLRGVMAMAYLSNYQTEDRSVWSSIQEIEALPTPTERQVVAKEKALYWLALFHFVWDRSYEDANYAARVFSNQGCAISYLYSAFWNNGTWPTPWPILEADCTTICGDGKLEGIETCDDDNFDSGDGCSSTCTIEEGFSCVPEFMVDPSSPSSTTLCTPCPEDPAERTGSIDEIFCFDDGLGDLEPPERDDDPVCSLGRTVCTPGVDGAVAVVDECIGIAGRSGTMWSPSPCSLASCTAPDENGDSVCGDCKDAPEGQSAGPQCDEPAGVVFEFFPDVASIPVQTENKMYLIATDQDMPANFAEIDFENSSLVLPTEIAVGDSSSLYTSIEYIAVAVLRPDTTMGTANSFQRSFHFRNITTSGGTNSTTRLPVSDIQGPTGKRNIYIVDHVTLGMFSLNFYREVSFTILGNSDYYLHLADTETGATCTGEGTYDYRAECAHSFLYNYSVD